MKRDFRRRVKDSANEDFLRNCDVVITDSYLSYGAESFSPTIEDYFKAGMKNLSFDEFCQDCADFAETTNGYFDIFTDYGTTGETFVARFYTSDNILDEDEDERGMEGTEIGYVEFALAVKPSDELANQIQNITDTYR